MFVEKKFLIIDLDGTIVHSEVAEIKILGRLGFRYISKKTAALLSLISKKFEIIIATGRNSESAKKIVCQIPEVSFFGFIMENGFVCKKNLFYEEPIKNDFEEIAFYLKDWEKLLDYQACLGFLLPETVEKPEEILQNILKKLNKTGYIYRENKKIFVYAKAPNKLEGVKYFKINNFLAFGNDLNDFEILQESESAYTIKTANKKIIELVKQKRGYISNFGSHEGSEDVLKILLNF